MGAVSQEVTRRAFLVGQINSGATANVQTLPLSGWFGWEMTCIFYFVDKSKTKMLKSVALYENGQVEDTVYARLGSLNVGIETKIIGSDVVFSVNNADTQTVFYRITQNNY